MIKKCFLPCIALNLSLLSCKFTSSTSTSLSALPFFSVYTLLFMSLAIVVFRSFSQFGCNRWIIGSSLWNFVITSSKTVLMPTRNAIYVPTSFDSSVFLMAMYLSLLLTLASFGNSTSSNLLTASLIFTSHSKAGIRESQWLWTWCSKISSSSPRDSLISNRSCHWHELLLKK